MQPWGGPSELVVVGLLGVSLLHEDEHVAPWILEPGGAQADDVGDALGEEANAFGFQVGAGGGEVVADKAHVAVAVIGQGGIRGLGPTRCARVLDDLEHTVAAGARVAGAEDGALDRDRSGNELAHVPLDVVALHQDRRPDHREAEHRLVPAHGLFHVRDANGGVGQADQHQVVGVVVGRKNVTVGVEDVVGVVGASVGGAVGGNVFGRVIGARRVVTGARVVDGAVVLGTVVVFVLFPVFLASRAMMTASTARARMTPMSHASAVRLRRGGGG